MGEPHPIDPSGRPKLGELLVQRGLLTQEQLGAALAEQQASGLPLGAIVVRDGLVPTHTVAILLAEQSGGPLKTEFGYAVGASSAEPAVADVLSLRPPSTSAPVEPPVSERPLDGLRLALPESSPEPAPVLEPVQALRELVTVAPEEVQAPPAREPRLEVLDALQARLEAEVAARTALEAKLADVEAGTEAALAGQAALEAKLAELEARAEAAVAARSTLEQQITQLATRDEEARAQAAAARTALEQRLTAIETRTEEAASGRTALEQDIVALRARADEAEANVREAADPQAALSDRLAALELRADELTAVRTSEARPLTGRPYTSARHMLLAPIEDRYELVERPGPAPVTGTRIELFGDRAYLVVRVGPAPIPGALEACAFLEPIPTRFPPPDADTELT